jgi:hypothetical protein
MALMQNFLDTDDETLCQHYALLIGKPDFDRIFQLIQQRGMAYWADPAKTRPGRINHSEGGHSFYFDDPNSHRLEVLTHNYGSSR